jgi:hypothetical protein
LVVVDLKPVIPVTDCHSCAKKVSGFTIAYGFRQIVVKLGEHKATANFAIAGFTELNSRLSKPMSEPNSGLARSSVDQLIRSLRTAEALLEAGAELPPGTTESRHQAHLWSAR